MKTSMQKSVVLLLVLSLMVFIIPLSVSAASCPNPSSPTAPSEAPKDFAGFVCILLNFMNTAFPIMVAATLLVFFWGLAKFIYSAGDEKKVSEGKQLIFWGIVALFVMVSIWGIINLLYADIVGGGPIRLPLLPAATSTNP